MLCPGTVLCCPEQSGTGKFITISHLTGNADVCAECRIAADDPACLCHQCCSSTPGSGISLEQGAPVLCAESCFPQQGQSTTGTSAEHLELLGWAWGHQTGLCRALPALVSLLCHCGVTGTNWQRALGFLFCKTQKLRSPLPQRPSGWGGVVKSLEGRRVGKRFYFLLKEK